MTSRGGSDVSTYTAGKLVSLNVGMPKPLPYRGKTVPSGIFKTPVEGSLRIDWMELEGDTQADPTGAKDNEGNALAQNYYWTLPPRVAEGDRQEK